MGLSRRSPVLTRSQAFDAGEDEVGGKALGLARLERAGAQVPPWVVLSAGSLVDHLGDRGSARGLRTEFALLDGLNPDSPDCRRTIERSAGRMRDIVLRAGLPEHLREDIADALEGLGPGPFAVRSSMTGEDSASLSFAGQLESYLFRRTPEEVTAAVLGCWASAFSARVTSYRMGAGEALETPRVGVVIQQMVSGQVSGVVFTAHPVTGRRDHALITAAWGLGEGVVSGACNTDEHVFEHGAGEVSCTVAHKDLSVAPDPSGAPGTVEIPVPEERRSKRCLSPEEVQRLGTEAVRVARELGAPQDIEWTLADGRLHLLQARPITSLPEPPVAGGQRVVFDNSNIQESYCGVTTPLTFSFASRGYASVYEQTMRVLGMKESVIHAHRPMLRNLLGLISGRIYYNINNWYRGLLLLPSFGRNKEDMEQMMGLREPVDFVEDEVLTPGRKLRRIPALLKAMGNLLLQFRRLRRTVPSFLADFEAAYARVDRPGLRDMDLPGLIAALDRLDDELLERWHVPIINDFYVMMTSGRLRRLIDRSRVEDRDALLIDLMGGEEGIESTEPTRFLIRLARRIRGDRDMTRSLIEGEPLEALALIRRAHADLAADIDRYIDRYGDRVMGELKLETVTLREDPTFVIEVLRNYLGRPDLDPDRLAVGEKERRGDAEGTLRRSLGLPGRLVMNRALRSARTAVKNRENMRLARTRMFGLYRAVFRALGRRLHEASRLDDPEDVFFLTIDEIRAYHEGRAVTTDLAGLAGLRRNEFSGFEDREPPHRIEAAGPVYQGDLSPGPAETSGADAGRTLRGIGCYPGVVESPVRVIMSPRDELSVNGRILVTVRTDPGWAPLFPTTGGILVERGSTLSHSAVVARELGIPAIVGIPNLVSTVRDGEMVRMDGAAGVVERVDESCGP